MTNGGAAGRDPLAADLARWAAAGRADEAAGARSRERWLRQQASEDAEFATLLLDLAERSARAVVTTTAGRSVTGRLVSVAADFCAVAVADGFVLLRLAAVASVRPAEPGAPSGIGGSERAGAGGAPDLFGVLAGLAAERPRVSFGFAAEAATVTGELLAVGRDMATVALDGEPGRRAYVRLDSVAEVAVRASG